MNLTILFCSVLFLFFLIPTAFQSDGVNLRCFSLSQFNLSETSNVQNIIFELELYDRNRLLGLKFEVFFLQISEELNSKEGKEEHFFQFSVLKYPFKGLFIKGRINFHILLRNPGSNSKILRTATPPSFKGTVVNRALPSLQGGSLKLRLQSSFLLDCQ